jgi:hypothetical protein
MSLCDKSRIKPPRGGARGPLQALGIAEPMSVADRAYDRQWPS